MLFSWHLSAQTQTDHIELKLLFGNESLKLNRSYALHEKDTVQITTLKFYVFHFDYFEFKHYVNTYDETHRLINSEDSSHYIIPLPHDDMSIDQIRFNLGVDSLLQISGAQGEDLDPIHGMYWTWQSGYINFKLEGTFNNEKFEYHIGGYQAPFIAIQDVVIPWSDSCKSILFNLDHLFEYVDVLEINHIMSPSEKAVDFSTHLPKLFSAKCD